MQISIVKNSILVIETSITAETVTVLKSLKPKALSLTDEDGNPTFTVGVTDKEPSISDYGIILNPDQPIAIVHNRPLTEAQAKEKYGLILLKLNTLEAQIAAVMAEYEVAQGQLTFDILD